MKTSVKSARVTHLSSAIYISVCLRIRVRRKIACVTGPKLNHTHAMISWWRHQMDTISALLAICSGNSPVNSPRKGQWRGALMFSFICVWIKGWVNNREAGDFRRYRSHYDSDLWIHSFPNSAVLHWSYRGTASPFSVHAHWINLMNNCHILQNSSCLMSSVIAISKNCLTRDPYICNAEINLFSGARCPKLSIGALLKKKNSFTKMHLKLSIAKWQPFGPGGELRCWFVTELTRNMYHVANYNIYIYIYTYINIYSRFIFQHRYVNRRMSQHLYKNMWIYLSNVTTKQYFPHAFFRFCV